MLRIGCHLSSSKGYLAMGKEAEKIDGGTFQFFTRNPRGGKAKEIDPEDVKAFLDFAGQKDIAPILAHAPYTLNGCSADEGIRAFAVNTMADDLKRMEFTPGNLYNFHPGSHVKQGVEAGIAYISDMLNQILRPEQTTTVLLETMAGKGSEVGRNFAELREILDRVHLNERWASAGYLPCVDAGYDIAEHLDQVLDEFDRTIGLSRLKAIHLNDSQNPLGAHKDRHARIGEGCIGLEALVRVINHPALRTLPFYLETPNDLDAMPGKLRLLKSRYIE